MRRYLAEAISTFALIFIGAGSVLSGGGVLEISLAHGLVLAAMIYATMHISGAHINPAVTISMFATKRIGGKDAVAYIIAQLAGAVAGAMLLSAVFVDVAPAVNNLGAGVSPVTGVMIEAVLTFFLVFVIFGTAVDKKSNAGHLAPLAIGLVLVFDHIFGLVLTGASMNPARTFGPALVSGFWQNHLVYWIGPIIGGLIAAFVYHFSFLRKGNK